jgi:hypothetical protein
MCVVTRDRISGRLVRLMEARDDSGKTLLEALESMPEESKRQCRNALRESAGLPIPPEDSMPIN